MSRTDDPGSRELGIKDAELLSISKGGELAIRLNTVYHSGYARTGTLARVPLSGGTPREVLDNVRDAEWSANGESLAIVRYVPENNHWRLEYPDWQGAASTAINWISHPKISPDGKWIAFADHENTGGDDEGSLAVIGADGKEQRRNFLPAGLRCREFSGLRRAMRSGLPPPTRGALRTRGRVTLSGKLRTITNVPGGMWLEDMRNGMVLCRGESYSPWHPGHGAGWERRA